MLKRKKVREKGKIKFSHYFQKLNKDEKVGVVRELALKTGFPKTLQGRTGEIEGKRGSNYLVKFKIGKSKRYKTFIIHPVHLKKLKQSKSKAEENKQEDKQKTKN